MMFLRSIVLLSFILLAHNAMGTLDLGYAHSCAVNEGRVLCWGFNNSGQLGNGTTDQAAGPKSPTGDLGHVVEVTTGGNFTCALNNSNQVFCWGDNNWGKLGNGTIEDSLVPVAVQGFPAGAKITALDAGNSHTCAIVDEGVMCWGWNYACALGKSGCIGGKDHVQDYEVNPRWVDGLGPHSGVTKISSGEMHTCAVVNRGLKCWGSALIGRLGDNYQSGYYQATPIDTYGMGPGSGVTDVATGNRHTCAVKGGNVYCFGEWKYLGSDTDQVDFHRPLLVPGVIGATQVSASTSGSCAVTDNGVYCWGIGTSGQLGDGKLQNSLTAVKVKGLSASPLLEIKSGRSHVCLRQSEGLSCWGWNAFCQVGNGICGTYEGLPQSVIGL